MAPRFARTFQALEYKQFQIMFFGTLFSFLGMQMQMIARGFLAFDLTGKNSALGGVMLAFGAPQLVLSLWGGVLADRLPKRKVLWVSQTIIAVNSLWLATMIQMDMVEYWMLIAAGLVQGSGFAFVGPARQAYIAELVPKDALGNAVVLQQLSMNSTRVIGPMIAGIMIGIPIVGIAGVYYLTSIGFIIAMLGLIPLPAGNPRPRLVKRSPIGDIADGLKYVRDRRAIALLILASFFIVMLGFPYQSFLPALAKDEYGVGPGKLGLLSSVGAVGAVGATMLVATYATHRRAWSFSAICGAGFGLSLIFLGIAPTYLFGAAAMFFVGALASAFQSLNNSICMQMTDPEYTGRVQSINMLSWSLFGIAALPIGFVADAVGLRETLALLGGICILCIAGLEFAGRRLHVSEHREAARRAAVLDQASPPQRAGAASGR